MTCDLLSGVRDLCRREALFEGVKTVCVGVSGGADSVCLLDVLVRLAPQFGLSLSVLHVHHGLRGEEADRDAQFVKALCARYAVPFHLVCADVRALAESRRLSLEDAGRAARYEAFRALGCDAIAVAHTMDDNVETMLFHLARGTSLPGFAGMQVKNGDVLRPLLPFRRSEIEAYLKTRGLSFVTDSTNLSDDYTRNRIRRHVVPALEEINPAFLPHASDLMADVREADDLLCGMAKALLSVAETADGYAAPVLLNTHPAVRKKALLMLLSQHMTRPPERSDLQRSLAVLSKGCGRTQLQGPLFFAVRGGTLYFETDAPEIEPWAVPLENGLAKTPFGTLTLQKAAKPSPLLIDKNKLTGPLCVRSARAGDAIRINRRSLTKPLKKLFQEQRLPPKARRKVPVLCMGDDIVWVPAAGVNAPFAADNDTKDCLEVQWQKNLEEDLNGNDR